VITPPCLSPRVYISINFFHTSLTQHSITPYLYHLVTFRVVFRGFHSYLEPLGLPRRHVSGSVAATFSMWAKRASSGLMVLPWGALVLVAMARGGDGQGGPGGLTQADIFIPQKMFILQTRLNLICGISFVCKNNCPIT
jgi:hypothetical protein